MFWTLRYYVIKKKSKPMLKKDTLLKRNNNNKRIVPIWWKISKFKIGVLNFKKLIIKVLKSNNEIAEKAKKLSGA